MWKRTATVKGAAMMGVEAIKHDPSNEARLVRAAQEGSRPAFAVLVEAYWERLFRWLFRATINSPRRYGNIQTDLPALPRLRLRIQRPRQRSWNAASES